jgi:hypothetical protein
MERNSFLCVHDYNEDFDFCSVANNKVRSCGMNFA